MEQQQARATRLIVQSVLIIVLCLGLVASIKSQKTKSFAEGYRLGWGATHWEG